MTKSDPNTPRGTFSPAHMSIDDVEYIMLLGVVSGVSISNDEHGRVRCFLHVIFPGSVISVGFLPLDRYVGKDGEWNVQPTIIGTAAILAMMRVVGSDSWEGIKGKSLYVLKPGDDEFGTGFGIANINDPEGNYLIFANLFQQYKDWSDTWHK